MGSKVKNEAAQIKGTFSVPKEVLYSNLKIGNSILDDSTAEQTVLNTSESIADINSVSIKKIEEKLNLTFVSEKDAESQVCMANNPEVRDEFKDIFDLKDLLDYSYGVLYSPNYLEKYKDLSKINFFEVSYPNDTTRFWKLVNLGAKLRYLNLLEVSSAEEHNDEVDEILKKIAAIKSG